jgi:hypothetical protein
MVKKHESETTRIEIAQLVADTLKLVEMESRTATIRFESVISRGLPPILICLILASSIAGAWIYYNSRCHGVDECAAQAAEGHERDAPREPR